MPAILEVVVQAMQEMSAIAGSGTTSPLLHKGGLYRE